MPLREDEIIEVKNIINQSIKEEINSAIKAIKTETKKSREIIREEIDKAVKPLEEKIKKLDKTPSKYASGGISSRN